jgi:hypothetical protein
MAAIRIIVVIPVIVAIPAQSGNPGAAKPVLLAWVPVCTGMTTPNAIAL